MTCARTGLALLLMLGPWAVANAQEAPPPRAPERGAASVEWQAPEPLAKLLRQHLPAPRLEEGDRRRASLRPWIRDVRRRVPQIAASEGFFSASAEVQFEDEARSRIVVRVAAGERANVERIDIVFRGDLAGEGPEREARRRELRQSWALPVGKPFRSADWETAKARLADDLVEIDYAAGTLAESEARVDADAAKVALRLVLDSGPRFALGPVLVQGLVHYPESMVRGMVDLVPGERYSAKRLLEVQRVVQEGPWFSSVVVDVSREPAAAREAPVTVTVTERPRRDVGLALGYGTDDGARSEVGYRDRDFVGPGYDLQSSLRISQKRQVGYADVYLPPRLWRRGDRTPVPFKDSVGVLAERSDIENLEIRRVAVAGYRHFRLEDLEARFGLSYQVERSIPAGAEEHIKRALAPIAAVTWRRVDDPLDPHRGGVLNVQLAAGARSLASGDDFVKAYAQYQHWIALGPRDQLLLRTEVGRTFTDRRDRIPEDFLFRAGGSRSNRGYAAGSLGVQEGQAVVGGRYLATGSVEYVHWLDETWGAAAFVDVGDASDSTHDWKANQSYGFGARFKTPAGPLAVDLAYAEGPRKFRFAFSVTVAF